MGGAAGCPRTDVRRGPVLSIFMFAINNLTINVKNGLTNKTMGAILSFIRVDCEIWYHERMLDVKQVNRLARGAAKILEVAHWTGAAAALIMLALSVAARGWLCAALAPLAADFGGEVTVYGFSLQVVQADGTLSPLAITLFSITAFFLFVLMAMVFRNVSLIFQTSRGKTWFSKGSTPFQGDVTRMVREMGIFYIGVPVVGLLMCVLCRLLLGPEGAETSVDLQGLVTGVLLLCLSQVFAYGARLQDDVDGLL